MERRLLWDLPRYSNYFHRRNRRVHGDSPEMGREYFFVTKERSLPLVVGDHLMTIVPQSNYRLLSYASKIAGHLQGAPAFFWIDAGAHHPDDYQWSIYRLTSGEFPSFIPSEAHKLLTRAESDVYFNRAQNILTYVKESCQKEDLRAPFFLHVVPVDIEDLPEPRKEYRFDNLDFFFNAYGILHGGKCAAARELPDYPIHQIFTGQYTHEARLWEGSSELGG